MRCIMTILLRFVIVASLLFVTNSAFGQTATTSPIRLYRDLAPGSQDFVIDFAADPVIEKLYQAGLLFDDNILSRVDIRAVYSSKTNRLHSQSFSCVGLRDPCDLSVTRTPEIDPVTKLPERTLRPWALIGVMGGRNW